MPRNKQPSSMPVKAETKRFSSSSSTSSSSNPPQQYNSTQPSSGKTFMAAAGGAVAGNMISNALISRNNTPASESVSQYNFAMEAQKCLLENRADYNLCKIHIDDLINSLLPKKQ